MRHFLRLTLALGLGLLACVPAHVRRGPFTQGHVAPGFEEVAAEFERNFAERNELGAACAVYYRGELVVDIWGGWRDARRRRPWTKHTMVTMFSMTKGMAAAAVAVAHARGWLDYDARVADYWPEFARAGKESITVRQLMNHEAGLAAVRPALRWHQLADPDALAAILARQHPEWPPGRWHGYHAVTLGLYLNELIRRADPQHRSIGQFFHEEVARPLSARFFIGVPDSVPDSAVAELRLFSPLQAAFRLPLRTVTTLLSPHTLARRALALPAGTDLNSRRFRSLELASLNGTGEVRAVARVYGDLATGGAGLGLTPATMTELTAPPAIPDSGEFDLFFGRPAWYRVGFMRPNPQHKHACWFGAPGMGGSFGFADPEAGIGFAYAPNRLDVPLVADPRETALRQAVYRCLGRIKGGR